MDLNELLHAHQVAVIKASASGDEMARQSHFAQIAEYADRIRNLRKIHLTTHIVQDPLAPPTIIYGSYAGNTAGEGTTSGQNDALPETLATSENPDLGKASR